MLFQRLRLSHILITSPRRMENLQCEVQYLRDQLDDIRQSLRINNLQSQRHSQENVSPRQVAEGQQKDNPSDNSCLSCDSQYTNLNAENEIARLEVPNNMAHMSSQRIHSNPDPRRAASSSHDTVSHSQYEATSIRSPSLKRKRSCFEISESSVAGFIDKGLITTDCAISCFRTSVHLYTMHCHWIKLN